MEDIRIVNSVPDEAKSYFEQGFNSAEAISLSFKEHFSYQDSLLPRLATGLGAGVGRKAFVVAITAAAVRDRSVDVGTTESRVDRDLIDLPGKIFLEMAVVGAVIGIHGCPVTQAVVLYHERDGRLQPAGRECNVFP